ncbi:MAG: APC family permease, partial [Halobacteriota archaeon]
CEVHRLSEDQFVVEEEATLKRDLGSFSSFSIGYADVGADIYIALGLVLFFGLGAAPLALAAAAVGYAFTALSYAELAPAIPVAGGSSSFTREAFGDFYSFIAGWGLLLDYTIDIAIFAWFTMGYLGGFAKNLTNAGYPALDWLSVVNFANAQGNYSFQTIGTIIFIICLIGLNLIGIKESASFNAVLSVLDIFSEIVILGLGFLVAWSAPIAVNNITQLGTGVSWSNFGWAVTVAMVSYIGLESLSQAAEETKNPSKTIPRTTIALIISVVVVALTVSTLSIGLTTLTPHQIATTYQADPIAGVARGVVNVLGQDNILYTLLPLWVGLLGFTIVAISANTGVIGSSRVAYSMGRHSIFPKWFGKVHPRFRVPFRTVIVFTLASLGFVIFVFAVHTFGLTDEDPTIILADLYNYGALIAFMLTNLSLIKLRNKRPELFRPFRSPLTIRIKRRQKGTVELPLLAAGGFAINLIVWLLVLSLHQVGRVVGTLWFIIGILGYYFYRRSQNLNLNEPIEGTLLTTPENALKLHPEIFQIPVSIDVVMEEKKEFEEVKDAEALEKRAREAIQKRDEPGEQNNAEKQSAADADNEDA